MRFIIIRYNIHVYYSKFTLHNTIPYNAIQYNIIQYIKAKYKHLIFFLSPHFLDDFFPSELDFSNFFHPEDDLWGGSEGLSIPLSGPGSGSGSGSGNSIPTNSGDKGG